MKSVSTFVLAGVLALSMSASVDAASLLGGLVKLGPGSSDSNSLLSINDGAGGTSISVLGKDGASVNLPNLTGGSSGNLPLSVNVSVPGVATVTTGGGTGGGGGGIGGGGGNGGNGGNGGGGGNGPIINYYGSGGGGGGGFGLPGGISERLRLLLQILAERDYLQLSNGRAVCLNAFGVAEVAGWIKKSEWAELQSALSGYSQDIFTLRQLLANCRSGGQREALNLSNLNRVIAIDIGADGRPVLFML